MSGLEDLARDYRTAFLRYLPQRSEAAMTAGYELGRRVASGQASLLDLVLVHHRILSEVLSQQPPPDPAEVTTAAGEFLTEVLATFDMAHRVLHEQPARTPAPESSAPGRRGRRVGHGPQQA